MNRKIRIIMPAYCNILGSDAMNTLNVFSALISRMRWSDGFPEWSCWSHEAV